LANLVYGGAVNGKRLWSVALCGKTLLDVCHEVATEAEWETYCAAQGLNFDALRRKFSDDCSECAFGAPKVEHSERPFDDSERAAVYLAGRAAARDLLGRAVRKMIDQHWKAQARRAGQAVSEPLDLTLVLRLDAAIDAMTIHIEEVEYHDLLFFPPSADRSDELVALIRDHESRMDPRSDKIEDFQREISALVGKPIALATFRSAMRLARVSPEWFAKGRKRGSPSYPKDD
jgi:hypothetical protein